MDEVIALDFSRRPLEEQLTRARAFYELCRRRRSVRMFSPEPVPRELVETLIRTAGCAPSGANKQPWRFVVVDDAALKREIRLAAEEEERRNYQQRFTDAWRRDLAPLGTDWHKEFLEIAPSLIVVFRIDYELQGEEILKHYYVHESVGIAVGFLLVAIHNAGLVTLPYTPSPMGFLARILGRPRNEKPYIVFPVGYPAPGATVPALQRKGLKDIMVWNRGEP